MLATINSVKHYVQQPLQTVASGGVIATELARAVEAPTNANEVRIGAVIKAVYLEQWCSLDTGATGTAMVTLVKTPDSTTPNFTDMTVLHDYNNKKNVLYHTQGLVNQVGQAATPLARTWFKIPKGKQRFGRGDRLYVVTTAQVVAVNLCGFVVFKEYY